MNEKPLEFFNGYQMHLNSLDYIGVHRLGNWAKYHYYTCKHCSTDYPVIEGRIMCNGQEIFDCSCLPAVQDKIANEIIDKILEEEKNA